MLLLTLSFLLRENVFSKHRFPIFQNKSPCKKMKCSFSMQPTRLPHPWDSPGKNTGVGCHFLLQCIKVKSESEVTQLCPTLGDPMDCGPPGSSIHRIFQARVLEWGAIAFSLSMSRCCHMKGTFSNHSQLWGAVVDISVDWQPIGIVKETKALNDRTLRSDITRKRKKERNQPSKGIFPLLYILFFFPTLQHTENIICFSTFQKTL